MANQMDSDQIAQREFGHALRGYDSREVRAFLEEVAGQVATFAREAAELRRQLGELDATELEGQIDQTAADVANVLHAAQEAAQSMRARAADDAETRTVKTNETIGQQLRAADADSYQLRKAAWETSTKMLDDVRREWAELRKQADKDTLAITGEAERNAHRKMAESKREAEARTRGARLESEKMLVQARARRDELLDEAERVTDAAQERVRALERRRDELLRELEAIRNETLTAAVEPHPPPSEYASTTVKLLPTTGESERASDTWGADVRVVPSSTRWADGSDTVRLIQSSGSEPEVADPLDADAMVDEVARLRTGGPPGPDPDAVTRDGEPSDSTGDAESSDEAATSQDESGEADEPLENEADPTDSDAETQDSADEQTPEPAETSASAGRAKVDVDAPDGNVGVPGGDAHAPGGDVHAPRGDELGNLFDLLRDDDLPKPAGEPEAVDVSEETPVEDLIAVPLPDPVELRDRTLLPAMNRVLRAVKRALSEVQNGELEALKNDPDGFVPDGQQLTAMIDPELGILGREAWSAGLDSALTLARAENVDRSELSGPPSVETSLAADALAAVNASINEARAAALDAREISAAVSKVYRVWRADEAERRIRHIAHEIYHRAMASAFAAIGVDGLVVTVDTPGCELCEQAAGDRPATDLADGDGIVPPYHEDCRCTLIPA